MRGELFIAYANYHNRAKQPVYRLQQNKFILNQTLDSYHLVDVEYLTIHGDHFLVVASQYYGTSSKQDYVVYRWEAGKFKEFQRIPTTGAMDTHYFTINTRKYMSFTNGSYKVAIYEWINKKFCHKIQDIQIKRPCRCTTFTIQNITYMVCGTGATVNTVTVLKWSGEQFESFQVLPSSFVNGRPHIIHANGTVYLALANFRGVGNNPDIHSFIYRWNGIKFVHHQSISTHGAMGSDSFSTAAGEVILVVVNSYTMSGTSFKVKSDVYKMVNDTFYLHQQLSTTGAEYVHAFTHKGKQYLVVVNKLDLTNFLLDSPVYIWNWTVNYWQCHEPTERTLMNYLLLPSEFAYSRSSEQLSEVPQWDYLGIRCSNNLRFGDHCKKIASKASKSLGLIRRCLKPCRKEVKERAYMSHLRLSTLPLLGVRTPTLTLKD